MKDHEQSTKPGAMQMIKTTCLLLVVAFLHTAGFAQKITLSEKNAPLAKVFRSIEKQSGYPFWYEYGLLEHTKKVTVKARGVSLTEALDLCLRGQPLQYSILKQTIVITAKTANDQALIRDRTREIAGIVTDSAGNPLQGVSIEPEGMHGGAVTGPDGQFQVRANPDAPLHFTLVSYQNEAITPGAHVFLNIKLFPQPSSLNDVVVIGYGALSKKKISGAVASVNTRTIENQPIASIDQALAGQSAGVRVAQLTGTPGGGAIIRIRGTGSISAGNEPLIVIDGFPVEGGYNRDMNPLATINPDDIESIQALKDASAAAIYGSRASNGVVIITTKRGRSGKPKVQFDTYYGIQQVANKIDMLNAREYALYNNEARNNAWTDKGGNATDPNSLRPDALKIPDMFAQPQTLGAGTDWQDEIFRSAPIQNHQVRVTSGNDETQYMLSAGYFNQRGVVVNTGFERYSLRFNMDSRLSRKIKIGLSLSPTFSKNDALPVDDQVFLGGILGSALAMPPTVPVHNEDGSYTSLLNAAGNNIGIIDNPVAMANQLKGASSAFRMLGNLFAEWEIIKGLRLRTAVGADIFENRYSFYWPSTLGRNGALPPISPEGNASATRDVVWLNENTLAYDKVFAKKHALNVVAGISSQRSLSDHAYLDAINFPNDLVSTLNAGQIIAGGTDISEWSLFSYLARVNYAFDSRYLLTATIRRDGSSRFGKNNKWGTFPSASVGWNVAQEKFMRGTGAVSELKLRASYGYAGNNSIGNYNSIGLLVSGNYVFGPGTGSVVNGLNTINIANPDLGWERMKQTDLGVDLGLFGNRLTVVVDYFNKITSELLLNVPVPGSTGFSTALRNIGKVSNKGWEFTLGGSIPARGFSWKGDANISFYKNKVLALGPEGDPIISTSRSFNPQTHITRIGEPLASFYGYEAIGVYRNQEEVDKSPHVPGVGGSRPGDLKFRDVNGDGVITPLDITIIGSSQPDFSYGISNTFYYRNFSLDILIDGVQGVEVLNGSRRNIGLVTNSYSRRDVLGRWQSPENSGDGKTPRANMIPTGGNVTFVSSLLIEDASFVRLHNVHLRYAFPQKIFRTAPVQAAAIFASVQNAAMITRYQGFNPEQSLNGASSLTPGVDFNGYPLAKIFTVGLTVNFQ